MDFDGTTYDPKLDRTRLSKQYRRVYAYMTLQARLGRKVTLQQISAATSAPEASVSARLRDMRKEEFGSHNLVSERSENPGVWIYHLELAKV